MPQADDAKRRSRFGRAARCAVAVAGILAFAGCATVRQPAAPSLVPAKHHADVGPYRVFSNHPISADDPAVEQIRKLERQVEAALGAHAPKGEALIEVYVLDSEESFMHFLKFYYPELPPRRAFFIAQGPRRVIYAYRGQNLVEDLRHEATHALLHAAVADLPLWLDEGLAEYFEVSTGEEGRNVEHLNKLPDDLASGWSPDMNRLEHLNDVRSMSPRDYREAWAWMHFLLHDAAGNAALKQYLTDLRRGGSEAPPLSERLGDTGAPEMLAHVEQLRARSRAGAGNASEVVSSTDPSRVRLQDGATKLARRPVRKGFLHRLAEALGW